MALLLCERQQNWLRVVTVVFSTIGIILRFLTFFYVFLKIQKVVTFYVFFRVSYIFSNYGEAFCFCSCCFSSSALFRSSAACWRFCSSRCTQYSTQALLAAVMTSFVIGTLVIDPKIWTIIDNTLCYIVFSASASFSLLSSALLTEKPRPGVALLCESVKAAFAKYDTRTSYHPFHPVLPTLSASMHSVTRCFKVWLKPVETAIAHVQQPFCPHTVTELIGFCHFLHV